MRFKKGPNAGQLNWASGASVGRPPRRVRDGIIENFLLRQGAESSRCNTFSVGCRGRFRSDSFGRSLERSVRRVSVRPLPPASSHQLQRNPIEKDQRRSIRPKKCCNGTIRSLASVKSFQYHRSHRIENSAQNGLIWEAAKDHPYCHALCWTFSRISLFPWVQGDRTFNSKWCRTYCCTAVQIHAGPWNRMHVRLVLDRLHLRTSTRCPSHYQLTHWCVPSLYSLRGGWLDWHAYPWILSGWTGWLIPHLSAQ